MTSLVAALVLVAQQQVTLPTQVVTPEPQTERACITMQQVPCESVPPQTPPCAHAPCPTVPVQTEMRSKALFWTGLALIAGGATLVVGATTWARESEETAYRSAPCGTDPYVTNLPIAPCRPSRALLGAGAALGGVGVPLVWYGGSRVLVGTDGRQVTVRVKF